MAIDLTKLTPHKISRDLSGQMVYIYGQAGVGKTTLCSEFPNVLLLATEKGYNAIGNIYVQDITTWGELKTVVRELKKPEVKAMFSTIALDTLDICGSLCEKYICNQLGIENLGDGGWAVNGWSHYKKEVEETFRTIVNLGYTLIFVSHDKDKTFKRKDGTEYNQIIPTAQSSINEIVKNMVDLFGYVMVKPDGSRKIIFRSNDGSIDCKSRFKYMPAEVDLSYEALVKAENEAIDMEEKEHGANFVTDEKVTPVKEATYDYDALMDEFQTLTGDLMHKDPANGPKITEIVNKYLGKGKKVSETTRDQAEFISLINDEIKDTLVK